MVLSNLFTSSTFYNVLSYFLLAYGLSFLFQKCGIEKRWAFVPFYRIFILARCADMEDAGFGYYMSALTSTVLGVILRIYPPADSLWIIGVYVALYIGKLIYSLRIYLAICRLFGKKKRWVAAWIILIPWLPAIWWGMDEKLQPQYSVSLMDAASRENAADISGAQAESTGIGLSINLEERSVKRHFEKKYLLRDIHINIKPGRMVLLLGGSGAGKTTFLNAIIGYEKADAKILLNGGDVYKNYDSIKYDIGMVPQQDLMRYSDTVMRTLMDAAALRLPESVSHREMTARVNEVLDIFGLEPVKSSMVEKLSGGQKKRLSIAMEFISDPSLFILDEPDSGLDGVLAKDLMRRLKEISRQGKTVIVITHSPDRVAEYFDDVIVLAKDASNTGRLVFYGSMQECREFFGTEDIEHVVKIVNRENEGGEGRADELIEKFAEVRCNAAI